MTFYAPFCIPFILGASVMFLTLAWKWGKWLWLLPRDDKKRILFGIPTRRTLAAVWEVVSESLNEGIVAADAAAKYVGM